MTPPNDRLQPWKNEPPKTPDEEEAAARLEEIRSMPTLTPEALARVERRLRESGQRRSPRRLPIFAGLPPAILAGAMALALIVGGLSFIVSERVRSSATPSGTLAMAPTPAAHPAELAMREWSQPPPDVVDLDRRREGALQGLGAIGSVRASRGEPEGPARRAPAAKAKKPMKAGYGGLGQAADSVAAPADAELADRSMSGVAASEAAPAAALGAAPGAPSAMAGAGAPRPAGPSASSPLGSGDEPQIENAERLARSGRCPEAIAAFSRAADRDGSNPLVERALIGRARCRLRLGQQAAGREDLETYLSRFPEGRYAAEARSLLR